MAPRDGLIHSSERVELFVTDDDMHDHDPVKFRHEFCFNPLL